MIYLGGDIVIDNQNNSFPKRLKELLDERRMSYSKLSQELGINKSTISMWKTGKITPKTETVIKIADYFNVTPAYLMGQEERIKLNDVFSVGDKIREIRLSKGITQKQLSERLNTSQQNLAQYENGKRNPKIATLKKIADALNVELDELMGGIMSFDTGEEFKKAWRERTQNQPANNCDSLTVVYHNISEKDKKIISCFLKLNTIGQEKAIELVDMLTKIPEYKSEDLKQAERSGSDLYFQIK